MLTLSIDVMTKESCVALWKSDKSIQKHQKFIKKMSDNGNSEIIFEAIEELFSKSTYKINEIDRVITINGPGNYTNIRIGLAVAKGFSIALDIPYFAISSHELIANLAIKKNISNELLVLIDAKNDSFYTQYFNINQNSKTEIILESFESIKKQIKNKQINIIERDIAFLTLCISNNYSPALLESNVEIPEFLLAEIGSKLEINNTNVDPLYIRQPNAKVPENVKIYKNE
ncbi:MAG: tRNA (adenosine(37)-N6)-threonylcarbamoyltransferase complex dimerization subunit type 1 TsaB [Alphaproteobacteria bacterium]|jgi:tRNA threonylcarbamoyladenosine biosynthesis protein TsaB|tara:strand:+ start:25659 stop:26348 length:690 start_codon:yes stop_codon:yes gene_type:complete